MFSLLRSRTGADLTAVTSQLSDCGDAFRGVKPNQTATVSYISRSFLTLLRCQERLRVHNTAAKMEVTAENCQTRREQKAVTMTAGSY